MAASPIEHVVIIVKENHAFDTYFGRYAKADGDGSLGQCANPPNQDPNHSHATWLQRHTKAVRLQYTQHDIPRYYSYARKFTLCDRYFSEVAGPSTPNHLMLIAAASPIIINPPHYRVTDVQPVFDLPSLAANLEQAGLTWANYGGYAFDMIKALKGRSKSSTEFVVDASAGKLPSVAWVYAPHATSEHPPSTPADRAAGVGNVTAGSAWTAAQVAAIVKGGLWDKVAIFITFDDWGGWYDHVDPPNLEAWTDGTQFRYGSRVPCLVVSPFARAGYVSKQVHSHVSLLRFCELNFKLKAVNSRTATADGMADCFDYAQAPQPPPK